MTAPRGSRRGLLAVAFVAGLVALGLLSLVQTGGHGLPPGGDFTLQSADGPLALRDLRGRVVLLFFGYSRCPDVCPTALTAQAAALRLLAPGERERVAGLFVSVDPEHETLASLQAYARAFHPQIRGATAPAAELEAVARRYGVLYAAQPADSAGQVAVDHTSDTFVIAPDGRLAARLPLGTPPDSIAAEVRRGLR